MVVTTRRLTKKPISLLLFLLLFTTLISLTDAAHSRKRIVTSRRSEEESSSYDRSITTFDPAGRLLQVEYGLAATLRGESVSAVWLPPPINAILVFVSQKTSSSSSNDNKSSSSSMTTTTTTAKVHRLDHHLWLFTAGLAGDARVLASSVRQQCLQHRLLQYGEAMTVYEAAQTVADRQHQLTRGMGVRPLGCTAIVVGMDSRSSSDVEQQQQQQPRIFRTDPGGILEDCLYCCAGKQQEQLMAALADPYENLVSSLSSSESSSTTTTIQDAIQQLLSVLKEKNQNGDENKTSFDVWLFRPNSNSRGKVKAACFLDVGSSESLNEIEAYFEKDGR